MLDARAPSRAPASVLAVLALGAPVNGAVFAHADAVIQAHRDRQNELVEAQQAVMARADAEKRELTTDEGTELDGLTAEFDRLDTEIARRDRANAQAALLAQPRGRISEPDALPGDEPEPAAAPTPRPGNAARVASPAPAPRSTVAASPRTAAGTGGFFNFGDFARAVKGANPKFGGEVDNRLLRNASASTYGNEGAGQDGGFLVPPDYRADIMTKVFGEDSLVGRTDRQRSSSNTITVPVDTTTPWQSTGGIQAYWVGEAATKTQSKPTFENVTIKAHTLAVLVPVTEELLEDASALDGYLRRKAPEKMDFKVSDSIIRGTGVGQPLGIMASPALVTVAAESAQTATTINVTNILKMFARMPVQNRNTAVWLIHPDAEVQLPLMTIGNMPIYLPPGGVSQAQYGNLLGRPVIPHQTARTLGSLGDIMFVDFGQYMTLTKTGGGRDANGMRTDVSIHLWFDQDLVAYRFTLRLGGMPWWSTTTAQASGSNAMSPYITLAAR
jgi:HK97 family phage major capsid protein